jgi:hypothetical protein
MWMPGRRLPSAFGLPRAPSPEPSAEVDSGVHPASRRLPSASPAPPDAKALEVPPRWRAVVERAVAKRADDRFQDARALMAAIRALRRPEEVGTSNPSRSSNGET